MRSSPRRDGNRPRLGLAAVEQDGQRLDGDLRAACRRVLQYIVHDAHADAPLLLAAPRLLCKAEWVSISAILSRAVNRVPCEVPKFALGQCEMYEQCRQSCCPLLPERKLLPYRWNCSIGKLSWSKAASALKSRFCASASAAKPAAKAPHQEGADGGHEGVDVGHGGVAKLFKDHRQRRRDGVQQLLLGLVLLLRAKPAAAW